MEPADLFVEAIKKGDLPQVEQLLDEHPDLLLDYGAQINARKTDGQTPLTLAAQYGHTEVAQLLKARGAEM